MKNLLLFLGAIIIGFILITGFFKLTSPKQTTIQIKNATPTTKPSNFSIDNPPAQSLKGNITNLTGDVKWQSRTATEAAKITTPQMIQQGENLQTDDDGKVEIQFSNTLNLSVLPKSEINFVQTLPLDIVISQSKGTVTYEKLGNIPVSIRSMHALIENNGKIKIIVDDTFGTIDINVLQGNATIAFNNIQNISTIKTAKAGQSLLYNDTRKRVILE